MEHHLTAFTLINPDASVPHKERLGCCYELAGSLAQHNPEVVLVHGSIQGMGAPRIGHAWAVLPDGSVWEPATNQMWKSSVFEAFFRPRVDKKYENQAMLRKIVRHEHWGPWEAKSSGLVNWTGNQSKGGHRGKAPQHR